MNWIVRAAKPIFLVAGALTCTMLYATFAPRASLASTFGETLEGPAAEVVVRSWGLLIALVGAMLIHAAFRPAARALAATVAATSKLVFVALVLVYDRAALAHQAGVAVVVDSIMVLLFLAYLIAAPYERRP